MLGYASHFNLVRSNVMGTWILETLLWAVVTVAVCVAIWGLYLPNINRIRRVGSGIAVTWE
ncbi:hypothetical protein O9992_26840 [Vibrio lentus]|nr:hypothetical protein [Vibrio lentus]